MIDRAHAGGDLGGEIGRGQPLVGCVVSLRPAPPRSPRPRSRFRRATPGGSDRPCRLVRARQLRQTAATSALVMPYAARAGRACAGSSCRTASPCRGNCRRSRSNPAAGRDPSPGRAPGQLSFRQSRMSCGVESGGRKIAAAPSVVCADQRGWISPRPLRNPVPIALARNDEAGGGRKNSDLRRGHRLDMDLRRRSIVGLADIDARLDPEPVQERREIGLAGRARVQSPYRPAPAPVAQQMLQLLAILELEGQVRKSLGELAVRARHPWAASPARNGCSRAAGRPTASSAGGEREASSSERGDRITLPSAPGGT